MPAPEPPPRSQSLSHSPLTCRIPACPACENIYKGEGSLEGDKSPMTHVDTAVHMSSFVQIPKNPLPRKIHKHAGGYAGGFGATRQIPSLSTMRSASEDMPAGRDALQSVSPRSSALATYTADSDSDSEEDPSAEEVLRTFMEAYNSGNQSSRLLEVAKSTHRSADSMENDEAVRRPTIAEEKAYFEMQRHEARRSKLPKHQDPPRPRSKNRPTPYKKPSVLLAARVHLNDESVRQQASPGVHRNARDSREQDPVPEASNTRPGRRWAGNDGLVPQSPGIVEKLSEFADFGSGWGEVSTVRRASHEEIVLQHEPGLKGRATLTWWSLLTLEEKATGLLSMPVQSRFELFDTISRREFAEALGRAMARDTKKDASILLDLDPEDRAEILSHLTVSQKARALAAMPYDDRLKTIRYMHHDQVGPALVNMSHAELLKTFKGLDDRIRPAVFATLPSNEKTVVMTWTPAHGRATLLAKLDSSELSTLLLSLPVKECCTTLKAMHSTPLATSIMDVILEMPQENRNKIVLTLQEKDLVSLMMDMSMDSLGATVDGLSPDALVRIFRCLNPMAQALILDDLSVEDRTAVIRKLPPRGRLALIQTMPQPARFAVLTLMEPKDLAATLRSLDMEDALGVLEEMEIKQQAEVLGYMSGKDRKTALQNMGTADRAAVLSEMALRDRTSELKNMHSKDIAETLSEMPSTQHQVDALSSMLPVERGEILCALNASERQSLARLLKPEVLAATLSEMPPEERRRVVLALQPAERASALSAMSNTARAAVLKSLLSAASDLETLPFEHEHESSIGLTLQHLPAQATYAALLEMNDHDWPTLLLSLNAKARAAVLDNMTPNEAAEMLDSLLLEDRATTLRCMQHERAAEALSEMHPNKKAVLLSSLGDRDRQRIMGAMTPRNVGSTLTALPLSDCVSSVKAMDPPHAAAAITDMPEEERFLTVEALPSKERGAVLASMHPEEAAQALCRLSPDDAAATLRHLPDRALPHVLAELPAPVRDAAVLASPAKTRARPIASAQPSARGAILNGMDARELSATVRMMPLREVESALPFLLSGVRAQALSALPTADAVQLLPALSAEDQADLLGLLPPEVGSLYLKSAEQPAVVAVLTTMTPEQRAAFFDLLPDKVRKLAVRNILPTFSSARPAGRSPGGAHAKSPPRPRRSPPPGAALMSRPAPSTPGKPGSGGDDPVMVVLKFDEDYAWVVADESRRSGWMAWMRALLSEGIDAAPARVEIARLEQGSLCVFVRALPLHFTPQLQGGPDQRTALQVAEATLRFAEQNGSEGEMPRFLGGMVQSHSSTLGTPERDRRVPATVADAPQLPSTSPSPTASRSPPRPQAGGAASSILAPKHAVTGALGNNSLHELSQIAGGPESSMLPSPSAEVTGATNRASDQTFSKPALPPPVPASLPSSRGADGPLCGVGIGFRPTADRKHLEVTGLSPGGQAAQSNQVQVGDLIAHIDGRSVSNVPIGETARLVRGPPGSTVTIGFFSLQSGSTSAVTLTRVLQASKPPTASRSHARGPQPPAPSAATGTLGPGLRHSAKPGQSVEASAHAPPASPPTEARVVAKVDSAMVTQQPEAKGQAVQTDAEVLSDGSEYEAHEIWGSLKKLDHSIEKRKNDMQHFTNSILQMQAHISSPESPQLSRRGEAAVQEFFSA